MLSYKTVGAAVLDRINCERGTNNKICPSFDRVKRVSRPGNFVTHILITAMVSGSEGLGGVDNHMTHDQPN